MVNLFENKKIILLITPDVKLYKSFEDNLNSLGFIVSTITFYKKFQYKSIFDRLKNFVNKTLYNDKSIKKKLERESNFNEIYKNLDNIPAGDFSLTIRADLFDLRIIERVLKLSTNNYSYQWDGLSRFPDIYKYIPLFKKFYVFDKNDLSDNSAMFPTTNFYFDCYNYLFENKIPKFDAYFIGSYDSRIDKLIQICEFLVLNGLKLNIILCCRPKKNLKKYKYITYIKKPLSYFENLENVSNSKMLIDINHSSMHQGLSFRTFEAIGYNKKLITSNEIIFNYDFFDHQNIFIINKSDQIQFGDFLKSDYNALPVDIKYKYSFTNWINYILEVDGHIPLELY